MKKRIQRYAFHIGHWTLRVSRWTLYASAATLALLAIVFTIAHHLLPMLEERKPELEQFLSLHSGHRVQIESLHAYWDGLHPGAQAKGMQVFATDGRRSAIRLSEVRISLALLPLLWGKLEINSLVVVNPSLVLERLADGRFRISGFNPLQAEQQTDDEKFIGWLFRQGRLEIENGEFQWIDLRSTDTPPVHLAHVNLSLENRGNSHRLEFNAEFPPRMCRECSLTLDITGNPFVSPAWDGEIYLRAAEVDVDALPLVAREKLPESFRGKFNVQLWSDWNEGRPVAVRGHVRASGLRLPVPGPSASLDIREAGGDLSWKTSRAGWRIDIANPVIGLVGPVWSAEHIRIVYQPDDSEIQIKHLNIGDITGFAMHQKNELVEAVKNVPAKSAEWLDYWLTARPEGGADNINLRIYKDGDATDFLLETDISAAAALPYQKYPGVQGLSGHLSVSRQKGSLRLDSGNISVSLPRIFRAPLKAKRASAELSWNKFDDYWLINGDKLRVTGEHAQGTGKISVRVPLDNSVSPQLKLRVDFHDGNGAYAALYYPAEILSPSTLAWMERSFLGGEITEGYLIYDGPIRDFPFRQHTGKFELRGHVRRGVYRFLPGWEPVKQAEVDVAVNGPDVVVTGNGKIGTLDASQVVVRTQDTGDGQHVVHVSSMVTGPVNETLKVLRAAKSEPGTASWLAYVPAGLQGAGEGILSLDLNIPLGQAQSTTVSGEYRFLKSALRLPGTGVSAEGIEGSVHFSESGIRDGTLRSRLLGGETVLAASQVDGRLKVRGEGVIPAQSLAPMVGARIAPRIAGSLSWNGSWQRNKEAGEIYAEVDLRNLKTSLPAPLDQPKGLADEKLIIRTESSTSDKMALGINVGTRMSGRLLFGRETGGWSLTRGRIGFGEPMATLPKERGLQVSARLDEVDVDQWWPLLGDGTGGVPTWLNHVSAEVRSLNMLDRRFGNFSLDFMRDGDSWHGNVGGDCIAGSVKFSGKGPAARYELDLTRLVLPDRQHDLRDEQTDPRRFPTVELRSKSFEVRNKQLGALDFAASPGESGWIITRLNFTRPEMKLGINGNWQYSEGKHSSSFVIEFNSTDIGKTMEALGMPDQVTGGEASVKAQLSWPGSPANVQLASVNGGIEVSAKKGRFLHVKQGAGRLFGLLDLSAISRYLTLDFSPVFGKGFIYDKIRGEVTIEKGNAYTRSFSIHGPAMQIDIGGRIGLAVEDYDLVLELQPKISDAVTIASWGVWGPQVAAVMLAVQKIFKNQIAAGTRITYVVKGPWNSPVITKQEKEKIPKFPVASPKTDDEAGVR